jgi:CRP/FNR family cyclic AMP-dependent transcriptional regulator
MAVPYELNVIESCVTCKLREDRLFCNLKGAALQELDRIKFSTSYPAGSVLFAEGEQPRGVMIICQGRVKLSMSSANGKTLIVKIAEAGEVLGLSATIAGQPHDITAETIDPSQLNVIRRDDFHRFLSKYPDACLKAAQELSSVHNTACHEIRMLGLSQSVPERLARLLLDWESKQSSRNKGHIHFALTHEEIAEFLGTSRETVTRILMDFKKRKIIQLKGATLTILDRHALETAAGEAST